MVGATLVLGVKSAPLHALVQGAGLALHMSAARFRRELAARPALQQLLLRYCYVLFRQLSQTAACTHYHAIQARLARWLLMTQDRARGASLHLTQEFLSGMLGVRRVGVTQAARSLQARHLIGYHRGEIVVVNRSRPNGTIGQRQRNRPVLRRKHGLHQIAHAGVQQGETISQIFVIVIRQIPGSSFQGKCR